MMYILNLHYILEIKHIAKCGSSAAFPSDLNKKRNFDSMFFGAEEPGVYALKCIRCKIWKWRSL